MNKNHKALAFLIAVMLLVSIGIILGENMLTTAFNPSIGSFENELDPGEYFTIKDKNGKELDKTSRQVYAGDEFITEDNMRYRIEKIEDLTATAHFVNKEDIAWEVNENGGGSPVSLDLSHSVPVQGQASENNLIAIYHTHSDESYIPTDGAESKPGEGGIFKVGKVFAQKLESLGIEVVHDLRSHEPHDSNAYLRSRRTATKLLSKNPAMIIDVHRDGVPDPDFYTDEIANVPVSKIRLVVGRQNQNMQANLDFAKRLKGYMDQKYPGFVKGIFMAKGNYNQDLSPRSILVEAGTHTIKRERAEKGIALFAEALPPVLGVAATQPPEGNKAASATSGDTTATIFIIVALILGLGIYLVISTGSIEAAIQKLKEFITVEWANFLGKRKTKE